MPRFVWSGALLAFGLVPSLVLGQGAVPKHDNGQWSALQKGIQKAIAAAEPSIACILVSRSDGYRRFGGYPAPDPTGKLGDFDPHRFDVAEERSKDERVVLRRKLDLADAGHVPEAFGSGVVIDAQGLVLTNYHVIRDATKIYVRLPGGKGSYADIHAADPRSDLAVLRLLTPPGGPMKTLGVGDASRVQRGQFVLSLANPFAVGFRDGQPSASWGIISNVRRRIPGQPREEDRTKPLYYYGMLLQTDARLHLGSSGGALLNMDGELIGLTTSLAAIQGGETPGGFALPLDAGLRRILDVLKRGEEVEYGFLGVGFNEQRSDPVAGVTIDFVTPGSPAELEARLRPNDAILAVNGIPVQESDDLFLHLGTQLAGNKVKLRVLHTGTREIGNVDVTLGKFFVTGKKIASSHGKRPFVRGLRVDYTTLLVQQPPRLVRVPAGVLVSEVLADTAAAKAQLKPGEIITHVNNRPVTSPAAFYQVITPLQGPIELQLHSFGPQDAPFKVVLK